MRESLPRPEPKLRGIVYVVGVLLLVGVAVTVWQAPMFLLSLLPWPTFTLPGSMEETPPPPTLGLDERYTIKPTTYGLPQPESKPREPIPTAVPVARAAMPPVVTAPPVAVPAPAPVVQAQVQPTPDWLKLFEDRDRREQERQDRQEDFVRRMMQQQQLPRQGQAPGPPQGEKPKERTKTVKAMGKPMLSAEQQQDDPTMSEEARAKQARDKAAEGLIKPANWAVPSDPRKTLYNTQVIPVRLLENANSELPGSLVMEVTVPVFGFFGKGDEIIPRQARVFASVDGQAQFGQTLIPVKVQQIQDTETGAVIGVKALAGNADGGNGLDGRVNNHYGQLILAAGISAVLNIGVQTAAGTPGRGQYYQDPVQSAASDATKDIQSSAKSIIDRQLKRPPTITRDKGTFATIKLTENYIFTHEPTLIK